MCSKFCLHLFLLSPCSDVKSISDEGITYCDGVLNDTSRSMMNGLNVELEMRSRSLSSVWLRSVSGNDAVKKGK